MAQNKDPIEDEKTIPLRKPIKLQDRTIESIDLREPTAYEIEQAAKKAETSAQGSNILLVSLVSGLTVGEVGKIGARDFDESVQFVKSFLPTSRQTGND
ncbi:phage tail assembly protein [Telmatospirillum sp.]|uniref:phage tail assembly protein n=1 Tax=Telmatospirillum sp. TaxID=2079197 RepID=UPI002841E123|nr:phage tail assembly protein [Telmatospirillum sp.]MDR3438950.1 phage tail assembly protein [Telmatospirillum sp.]